ncbi:unnamed protein product [Phytomonas sp. Hart1]|nr:unnamed protein product [Phytomonas sp. Hart1]|eukprot:CCW71181.1 unnamed protein product [Phytomonas sp. isolate Hart1]
MHLIAWFAILTPCLTYFVCLRFFDSNLDHFAVSGFFGFSIGAFILWIYSLYLANKYLTEREKRDAQRAEDDMASLIPSENSNKTTSEGGTGPFHATGSFRQPSILDEEDKYGKKTRRLKTIYTRMFTSFSEDVRSSEAWFYHKGKRYVGPRTTRRLSPVIPAFLSLLYILFAAANALVVIWIVIIQMKTD